MPSPRALHWLACAMLLACHGSSGSQHDDASAVGPAEGQDASASDAADAERSPDSSAHADAKTESMDAACNDAACDAGVPSDTGPTACAEKDACSDVSPQDCDGGSCIRGK